MKKLKETIDCPIRQAIYRLTNENETGKRKLIFANAGKTCIREYLTGNTSVFLQYFQREYQSLNLPFSWSYDAVVHEDTFKWERAMRHVFFVPHDEKGQPGTTGWIRDANVELVDVCHEIETVLGWVTVPMIVKIHSGGLVQFHAYYLRNKKNSGYISNRAKKPDNLPSNNVILAAIKETLEHDYPGVTVHCLGMISNKDTTATQVDALGDADDAYHSFGEFYENGANGVQMKRFIEERLKQTLASKACYECRFENRYCHTVKYVVPQNESVNNTGISLTENQKQAVEHREGAALVCACPGSGKTAVLVERVKGLIAEGVMPERILLLTFSRSAVENLVSRIKRGEKGTPHISTIHSLCLELLRMEDKSIVVEERDTRYHILQMLIDNKKIRGATSGELYSENGFIVRLDKCICDMREGKPVQFGSFDEAELMEIFSAYEAVREQKHCLTYDELQTKALELLQQKPKYQRILHTKYQYIMVDEYQDVDAVQDAIVRTIAGPNGNLMVVGDDDQSIYGFRGGSNQYMLNFKKYYPDAKVITLGDNWRSTEEVVNFASRLVSHNVARLKKNFIAHKKGNAVECYASINWDNHLPYLINRLLCNDFEYGDIAIITRNNAELKKINEMLGSDITRINRSCLYNDPIFCTILSVLALWENPDNADAFLKLVVLHTAIDISKIDGKGILAFRNCNSTYAEEFNAIWDKLDAIFQNIGADSVPSDVFSLILEQFFGIREHVVVSELLDDLFEANIRNINSCYAFLRNLEDIQDNRRVVYPPDNRITLLTAHDSKGLEFPCVIVFGLEDFKYDGEESRRLLYVALTRAKEHLIVCQTEGTELSQYWNEVMVNKGEEAVANG